MLFMRALFQLAILATLIVGMGVGIYGIGGLFADLLPATPATKALLILALPVGILIGLVGTYSAIVLPLVFRYPHLAKPFAFAPFETLGWLSFLARYGRRLVAYAGTRDDT